MNAAGSNHRMSRFVTGAMSEMLPKCSAVSGTVNTMAPTELAVVALKKARIFRRGRESFTSAGSRRASSARYSAPETQNRPAMDANESCRLMLAAANGLTASNMANAVSSDVGGSFSRPSSGAKSTSAVMNAARSTDGLHPAMTTNTTIIGRPMMAVTRRLPVNRRKKPSRNARCNPETATVCMMPVVLSGMSRSCA